MTMADERTSESEEGLVHIPAAPVTNAQSRKLMQPGERTLNDPAVETQTDAMRRAAFGQEGLNATPAQPWPMCVRVVAAVPLYPLMPSLHVKVTPTAVMDIDTEFTTAASICKNGFEPISDSWLIM